jgi:hypothetical protein
MEVTLIPQYSRKTLRQNLVLSFLDTKSYIGNTALSLGAGATAAFMDSYQANPAHSGRTEFIDAWLYQPDTGQTFRTASFNAASGAYITMQMTATAIAAGAQFEVHQGLSPQDLNRCMDRAINRMRFRQELVITAVDGGTYYQIDGAASPASVQRVLDVHYNATPQATDNRDQRYFAWWGTRTTASGTFELDIRPPVASGNQIVIDAIIDMTLGGSEGALVNVPHDEWVYAGAALHAYNLLIQRAPGQADASLVKRRSEYAMWWRDTSGKYMPMITRTMAGAFDEDPINRGGR